MVLAMPFQKATVAGIIGYSAEDDIGLIPWDSSLPTRTANTNTFNSALDAMHYNGSFDFVGRDPGPVLLPIIFPGNTYYFLPPIKTSTKIGGAIYGTGGAGYIMLDGQFTWAPGLGGMKTRFVGMNEGSDSEPVFRIRCNGFEINGIDLYGGQLSDWDSNPQKAIACIQMEGSALNVTGQARIVNCGIYQATYGIQTLDGYYDDDNVFHTDENHADNTIVDGCVFMNVESCFRSQCVQSVNWEFRNMVVGGAGNHQPRKIVIFDMVKSGFVTAKRVIVNFAPVVMIRLDGYSPHMCGMDISEVYTDRAPTPTRSGWLTLVSYEGTSYYEVTGSNTWRIRVTGGFGDYNFRRWDTSRLIYANPSSPLPIPLTDIYVDMLNLPTNCMAIAGEGPYYKVDETVANYQSEVRKMSSYYRLDEKSGTSAEDEEAADITATTSGTVYWMNDTSTYDNKYKTRAITNASWSSSVATFTSTSHGFEDPTDPSPIIQRITVSGVSPSGYNGIYTITAITDNTFSVAMVSDPGSYSTGGTVRHAADGGGLYMASTGAYLDIPYATENLLYVNSTIAFWIYLNSWTNGVVLSRVNTAVNSKSGFRTTSGGEFWLTESGLHHVNFASGAGANLFTTKQWFHIAVSLAGDLAYKAYINGTLATIAGGDPGTMTGGEWLSMNLPLRVGAPSNAFYGSGSNSADMIIDDIRLYKRVLSDGAVAQLYDIGNSL